MQLKRTFLALSAALALGAAPATAESFDFGLRTDDFGLRISAQDSDRYGHRSGYRGDYRGDYRRSHRPDYRFDRPRHFQAPNHGRHYVEGHYEDRVVQKWVPAYYETVHIPAQYRHETFHDSYGRLVTRAILVRPACTEQVLRPGYWTTVTVRSWVPGCWVGF